MVIAIHRAPKRFSHGRRAESSPRGLPWLYRPLTLPSPGRERGHSAMIVPDCIAPCSLAVELYTAHEVGASGLKQARWSPTPRLVLAWSAALRGLKAAGSCGSESDR
jgi:hypothetical protein